MLDTTKFCGCHVFFYKNWFFHAGYEQQSTVYLQADGKIQSDTEMFREAVQYLATPCLPQFRRLGYLKEAIGIMARYRRCRTAWLPHLQASQEAIIHAAENAPHKRRVLVLGSGALYDVPLAVLSAMFHEVLLVDVIHPLRARRMARNFDNVTLIDWDVTDLADAMTHLRDIPDVLIPERFTDDGCIDLAVSANLLSQLPILPLERLKASRRFSEEAMAEFAFRLSQAHLDYLRCFASACLITDLERQVLEKNSIVFQESAIHGVDLPNSERQWLWNMAPSPEAHRRLSFRHRVGAVHV